MCHAWLGTLPLLYKGYIVSSIYDRKQVIESFWGSRSPSLSPLDPPSCSSSALLDYKQIRPGNPDVIKSGRLVRFLHMSPCDKGTQKCSQMYYVGSRAGSRYSRLLFVTQCFKLKNQLSKNPKKFDSKLCPIDWKYGWKSIVTFYTLQQIFFRNLGVVCEFSDKEGNEWNFYLHHFRSLFVATVIWLQFVFYLVGKNFGYLAQCSGCLIWLIFTWR